MWQPPVLETERLLLRPVRESDAADIFEYCSDERIARYVAWRHKSLADTLEFIAYGLESYRKEAPDPLCITLKPAAGKVVGHVGCFWDRKGHSMEIGWILAERWRGAGLATEAARAAMDFAFSRYPIERLQCTIATDNAASRKLAERLGMTFEGVLRAAAAWGGESHDQAYYSVLRGEWAGNGTDRVHDARRLARSGALTDARVTAMTAGRSAVENS